MTHVVLLTLYSEVGSKLFPPHFLQGRDERKKKKKKKIVGL